MAAGHNRASRTGCMTAAIFCNDGQRAMPGSVSLGSRTSRRSRAKANLQSPRHHAGSPVRRALLAQRADGKHHRAGKRCRKPGKCRNEGHYGAEHPAQAPRDDPGTTHPGCDRGSLRADRGSETALHSTSTLSMPIAALRIGADGTFYGEISPTLCASARSDGQGAL